MLDWTAFWTKYSDQIITAFWQHIWLSLSAEVLGFIVALPAGILLTRHKRAAKVVLAVFGVINTIPSLVLLGVAMMLLGLGFAPALAVLFVYSLLPILTNTYTGIVEVEDQYIKAATGMGMNSWQILIRVQLPLASPVIVGGIRISTVYIISWATLGAFIGAGGLGDLIWAGLASYNIPLVFAGAIPATILAMSFSLIIGQIQKAVSARAYGSIRKGAAAK